MKKSSVVSGVLTLAGLLVAILHPPFFEIVERKLYDIHFALRGSIPTTGRITLVTVDEKSLQNIGRWPWPRSTIARLFEEIASQGATMILPDIFFAEPTSGAEGARIDQTLAETLHRHPNIFMGYFFLFTPEEVQDSALTEERLEENFRNVSPSALSPSWIDRRSLPRIRQVVGIQDTLALFSNLPGGKRQGFFNILSDPDGTIRSQPLLIAFRGKIFPSMTLQAALSLLGALDPGFIAEIPTDSEGDLLIHYRGPGSLFPRVSADTILEGGGGVSLRDKIVVVGATAAGLADAKPTPLGPAVPSDLVLANALDNLLKGDFLRRDLFTQGASYLWIVLAGLTFGIFLPKLKPAKGLFLFLLVEVVIASVNHLLFVEARWVMSDIYPLFSAFLVYGGTSLHIYLVQEREKRFIRETFERYLAPDVVQELTEHPEKVRLGGEKKELTVFFSDIRDFTTIVEATPPDVLVDLLNAYLTVVTDIIFEEKGLLDKYIGDAVMAVFGAPLPEPEHPKLACEAAVRIVTLVSASQEKWRQEFGVPVLQMGIGINTGPMTVGNMGSERRFDYTVVGDAVNLASRLEGLNKFYGTTVIVSSSTYERVKDLFLFRELDEVQVKGKKETLRIYELLVDPAFDPEKFLPLFAEGRRVYCKGAFTEAKRIFEECLAMTPKDGPSRLFLERCQMMEVSPPEDWQGVTTFLRK